MADNDWTKVAKLAELPEGEPVGVEADGEAVVLVRRGNKVHACGGECTHYGAPLANGVLRDHILTCPWHSARFDVETGQMASPPALFDEPKYPVRIRNGQVFVGASEQPAFPPLNEGDERTFVIVGGGAAGHAAAETLRREAFGGRIVLVTAEDAVPYDRPSLSKGYLAGESEAGLLPLRGEPFYREHQIEVLRNTRVVGLDPAARTLSLEGGKTQAFNACLLATGGVPRNLAIPGVELKGYCLLRSLSDADAVIAAAAGARAAVVLGASFIGLEVAGALRERGIAVHVVAPEDVPMARLFGERVGRYIQGLHENEGVIFHLGTAAKEIAGRRKVEAVVLEDGSRLEADLVVAGVGIRPALGYLEGTGLVEDGAVPVDGRLETKAEGVFAAGDIAVVPDARTGEAQRIEHWIVAERQGQHAARSILGSNAPYGEPPFFWTMQQGNSFKYVGHAATFDHIAYRGNVEEGEFAAAYYRDGVLSAAAALSLSDPVIYVGMLLREGKSLPPEDFESPDLDFAKCL